MIHNNEVLEQTIAIAAYIRNIFFENPYPLFDRSSFLFPYVNQYGGEIYILPAVGTAAQSNMDIYRKNLMRFVDIYFFFYLCQSLIDWHFTVD